MMTTRDLWDGEPRAAEGNERARIRPGPRQRRATLNNIAQSLGYDIVEAETGPVVIMLVPNGSHLNAWGTVHGGLTATLLDSCMGLAVQSTLERGFALEFKISVVRAITPETGEIRAEGKVLNAGRRIGTAEGRVIDHMGRLLTHGTTTCLIFEN